MKEKVSRQEAQRERELSRYDTIKGKLFVKHAFKLAERLAKKTGDSVAVSLTVWCHPKIEGGREHIECRLWDARANGFHETSQNGIENFDLRKVAEMVERAIIEYKQQGRVKG